MFLGLIDVCKIKHDLNVLFELNKVQKDVL